MNLTPEQRKLLELCKRFHTSSPTTLGMIARTAWTCQGLVIFSCLVAYLAISSGQLRPAGAIIGSITGVFIGLTLAAILLYANYLLKFARVWPALSHVIDWEKVDDCLSGRQDWS